MRGDRVIDLSSNGGPASLLALVQAGPDEWQRAARAEATPDGGYALSAVRLQRRFRGR